MRNILNNLNINAKKAVVVVVVVIAGCSKQDKFLDAAPDISLAIPSKLIDFQLLLQNSDLFNRTQSGGLAVISGEEFWIPDSKFDAASFIERNTYQWNNKLYEVNSAVGDWSQPYSEVYNANIILEGLQKLDKSEQGKQFDIVKGSALFFRSQAFFQLMASFTKPYNSSSAGTDLGIPLRLSSDLNIKSVRVSQEKCYDQIISDLQEALSLLPDQSDYKTLPTKAAAYGLLARITLSLGMYDKAYAYADSCLKINRDLTDYNSLLPASLPITKAVLNENIFNSGIGTYAITPAFGNQKFTDSTLIATYDSNDLRKQILFRFNANFGGYYWVGTYETLKLTMYGGIATDEMWLTRAECLARKGQTDQAMSDLNELLSHRWKAGTYEPLVASSADDALSIILLERRKELLYRGVRWIDLRRLNQESRFAITLKRTIDGIEYSLPPNDPRYALPIPDAEIKLSGIQQNER